MKHIYLHFGFTDASYKAPYWEYPHAVLCPEYGFGKYYTVWTFPTATNTADFERFIKDIKALPQNCLLYINHENGKFAFSNTGDIRTVNPEYIEEHCQLIQITRRRRPDILVGDFNSVPYVGYFMTDEYLDYIRQANAARWKIGNACHFLIPHLYPRIAFQIKDKDGKVIGERPVSLDEELWSFGQCLTAAHETWPLAPVIPAICVQYNHRVCELVFERMVQDKLNFRWTPDELEKCRLPKQRLYALLQLLTARGIERIMVWSAGMVPADAVRENLELLREWQNS